MTEQHTPGPWVVNFRDDGSSYICMGGTQPGHAHKQFDLVLEKGEGNDEFDARLIAAAPDTLDALRECRDWIKRYHFDDRPDLVQKADAAIAKGEGKQ